MKALSVLLVLVGSRGSLAGGVGAAVTLPHASLWGQWGQGWLWACGAVPDVGSQCGLERGRKGGLCPWQLLPALPWQHICFLHFPIPAKGGPQPFWHQHRPRKNPTLNKTPFHWSLSPGHRPLFNDCKSLYSVMDRTFSYKEFALLLQPCF